MAGIEKGRTAAWLDYLNYVIAVLDNVWSKANITGPARCRSARRAKIYGFEFLFAEMT